MSSPFTDVFDIDLAVVLILHNFSALLRSRTHQIYFLCYSNKLNNNVNASNNIDVFILTMTTNDAITVNNGITQANNFVLYDY